MEKLFHHMLVPFHAWEDADPAIRKAIDMANQWQTHLHLLRFMQGPVSSGGEEQDPLRKAMRQRYQCRLDPALTLTISNRNGQAEEGIIAYQRKSNIDLILLSRKEPVFWSWPPGPLAVNMNRLLKKVNCPVLNAGADPAIPPIRRLVLPVGEDFPMRKLLFATYLAKRSHSTIHLISPGCHRNGGTELLRRAYRLLRENTDLPVECLSVPEENPARAVWAYAKRIKADLILIQPGKESQLSGPLNAFRGRSLFDVSRIPVMAVP